MVRLVSRARRDVPLPLADHGPARQRLVPAAALARGSRAPPRRHAPDGRIPRRRDGPRARLPQRDVRAVRGARRRLGPPRQRAGRGESRPLLRADARARPLDDARDHEPAGRPLAPRRPGRSRRDRTPQGRRDVRGDRRARRAHARDARSLRRRDLDLPRQPAARGGHRLRALLRDPDEHAGSQGRAARLVREAAARVRLPALVALRRAGRDDHLRRRRRAPRPRVHGRRHDRLRRGHLAHELARPDRQPGDDARVDEARADVRPRARDHRGHRRQHVRPRAGEARRDLVATSR